MNCRVCGSIELELAVDLGEQPWCNNFLKPNEVGKEPYYPLRVIYCHSCGDSPVGLYCAKKDNVWGSQCTGEGKQALQLCWDRDNLLNLDS